MKDLTKLKSGEEGIITEIQGGKAVKERLESMGVREGKKISKISSQLIRGPQVIGIDRLRIAIGYGMAKKILIEVTE